MTRHRYVYTRRHFEWLLWLWNVREQFTSRHRVTSQKMWIFIVQVVCSHMLKMAFLILSSPWRDGHTRTENVSCSVLWSIFTTMTQEIIYTMCGSGSSVGIATELRAGRSGIESHWGRDFPPVQTGPGAHPASCKMGTGSFPGVKCGWAVLLATHPLLVPRSWKSRAIPLPTLWATPDL